MSLITNDSFFYFCGVDSRG